MIWRGALLLLFSVVVCASAPGQTTQATPTSKPVRPALVVPQEPGTHRLSTYVTVDEKELKLPFVLVLPEAYRAKGPKLPVLVFLHGVGESGTDLDAIFYHGPNFELAKKGHEAFTKNFPMILISPQCPPRGQRWDRENMHEYANALLDQLFEKLNADPGRVYATGLSMGGLGTWRVALGRPDRYAAIAPVSALGYEPEKSATILKDVVALAITGEGDMAQIEQSRQMAAAIEKVGGFAEMVTGPNGHGVWVQAYACPRTYEWLLLNRRQHIARADEPFPTKRGIYRRVFSSGEGAAKKRVDYILRLPGETKPTDKKPLLIHFPDPDGFGKVVDELPLHGALSYMADSGQGRSTPFVAVQVMLPPFAMDGHKVEDIGLLAAFLKDISQKCHADAERIYIAGSGKGAALALRVARSQGVQAAAVVLDVPADSSVLDGINADQSVPSVVLAATNRADGNVHRYLKALVENGAAGSELAVPAEPGKDPLSYPDLYQRLLRIKGTGG